MIYLTGDIHRDIFERFNELNYPIIKDIKEEDYLIVLGDFGVIWYGDERDDYLLDWLEKEPYTILFVEGNHSHVPRICKYPLEIWKNGQIHRIRKNIIHLMRGQVFNIENKKFFTFGGGNSIDKRYRIPGLTWWEEEMPNLEEKNEGLIELQQNNYKVDYILTHECSKRIFNKLNKKMKLYPIVDDLKIYLDYIHDKTTFKKWFFGHYHENITIENKYYLLYNKIIKLP